MEGIPVLPTAKCQRLGEVGQAALALTPKKGRWGLVATVMH
jgi:hypothetical protein